MNKFNYFLMLSLHTSDN